jgi:hypothetical protein
MTTSARLHLLVLALLWFPAHAAEVPVDAAETPTAPATESQQLGRKLLLGMANYLAGLDSFTVTVRGGFDVVQDDGKKIQFLEVRNVALARPDRLRAEETGADGRNSLVLFDGTHVSVFDGDLGVFAQADQPGTVDDAIIYFTRELQMRLPLAPLLTTRFPAELESRLQFVDYVETSYVFEEPAQQIVGSTGVVDFQVWIAQGDRPLPQRIVLTYRGEAGQPQYWADFIDWNIRPRISKSRFEFKPPKDAKQIVFAVQIVPPAAAPAVEDSAADGDTP